MASRTRLSGRISPWTSVAPAAAATQPLSPAASAGRCRHAHPFRSSGGSAATVAQPWTSPPNSCAAGGASSIGQGVSAGANAARVATVAVTSVDPGRRSTVPPGRSSKARMIHPARSAAHRSAGAGAAGGNAWHAAASARYTPANGCSTGKPLTKTRVGPGAPLGAPTVSRTATPGVNPPVCTTAAVTGPPSRAASASRNDPGSWSHPGRTAVPTFMTTPYRGMDLSWSGRGSRRCRPGCR